MVLNPVNEDFEDYYSPSTEEFLNESIQLDEMALPEAPGFGNDKYRVIAKDPDHLPLHAHVYSVLGKELGDFHVTSRPPKNIGSIRTYRKEIPEDAKQMIVEQAEKSSTILPELSNWRFLEGFCMGHIREKYRPN